MLLHYDSPKKPDATASGFFDRKAIKIIEKGLAKFKEICYSI